jgi:hypothetical protein
MLDSLYPGITRVSGELARTSSHLSGVALMITPIVRLAQAVEGAQRAHAEIEAEELLGHLNRFHQSKALQCAVLAEHSRLYL